MPNLHRSIAFKHQWENVSRNSQYLSVGSCCLFPDLVIMMNITLTPKPFFVFFTIQIKLLSFFAGESTNIWLDKPSWFRSKFCLYSPALFTAVQPQSWVWQHSSIIRRYWKPCIVCAAVCEYKRFVLSPISSLFCFIDISSWPMEKWDAIKKMLKSAFIWYELTNDLSGCNFFLSGVAPIYLKWLITSYIEHNVCLK